MSKEEGLILAKPISSLMNMNNKTYPLGGMAIIEKAEKTFGLFSRIFGGIEGNSKDFLPLVKVHVNKQGLHTLFPPIRYWKTILWS